MDEYLTPSKVRKKFDVSALTLQRWAKAGKINHIVTPNNRWLYSIKSLEKIFKLQKSREKVIYCRVSSKKQEKDLQRQIKVLQESYPEYKIFKDIGSGLNWKRKGFTRILEQVMLGNIEEIVVAHKDRLTRFAFDLFKKICEFNKTQIKVHYSDETGTNEEELAKDLLAIVNVFVARNNGRRKYRIGKNKEDKAETLPKAKKET
jgi:predicted site-specific integrase-resolvase